MQLIMAKLSKHITAVYLFIYCLTLIVSINLLWQHSFQQLQTSNQQQLDRFSRHLESQLGHFAFIPQLLSRQGIIIDALMSPHNTAQLDLTNRHLRSINNIVGASDTYLLDAKANTIAASNWLKEASFVGDNYAFRPYYHDAMRGEQGQYFALGSTSGRRGYYFSYPVKYAAEVIGVVVVKMDLSLIEKDWIGKEQHFLVSDMNNIVFISSEEKWLFKSLSPLSDNQKQTILNSRRYLEKTIGSVSINGDLQQNASILTTVNKKPFSNYYLSLLSVAESKNWNVRVFAPIAPIIIDILILFTFITLLYLLLYLTFILIKQKRNRFQEQALLAIKSKRELEYTVMQRTSALQAEVEERHKAEAALRSTQKELIQSAKLAVLGQLSASISHELNNPLSAIRTYAENAVLFLERNQLEHVSNNLTRIGLLTERMAKISSQLKSFARKPNGELQIIALQPVIFAAHELLKPQLKANKANLTIALPDTPVNVKAEPIQLEQIIVNLLSNALQSMQHSDDKQIIIKLAVQLENKQDSKGPLAIIKVLDKGTGIDKEHLPHLFEPFFTTKETGLGLGLSISQQIISNMKGSLSAQNRPEAGAEFTITLPLVINNVFSESKTIKDNNRSEDESSR
ncbi:ATP-binding protein [Psychromonas sp. SP041]|uniref:sensor histidine kinase n=1 Tax=Psychromonas sp. SP041 TaxID=1365007 RepID=UPI000405B102|nr:ATP-binding protein [Psychromonas sp. SP041]